METAVNGTDLNANLIGFNCRLLKVQLRGSAPTLSKKVLLIIAIKAHRKSYHTNEQYSSKVTNSVA